MLVMVPSMCSWWSNPGVLRLLQVEPNTAPLPPQQPLPIVGEKLHQVFHSVLENLGKVMDGYCLAEPYFSNKVSSFLRTLSQNRQRSMVVSLSSDKVVLWIKAP